VKSIDRLPSDRLPSDRAPIESSPVQRITPLTSVTTADSRVDSPSGDLASINEHYNLAFRLLEILNRTDGSAVGKGDGEDVKAILAELHRSLGFDAIAIRLRREDASVGIDGVDQYGVFVGPDRKLCEPAVEGKECMCGHILRGEVDHGLPCFTERGSFWSNDYPRTLATVPKFAAMLTRGTCIRDGYLSMTTIPLRSGSETLGLLHLADRRPNRFLPKAVASLEALGSFIALSLVRQRSARELREAKERAEAANRAKSEFLANMSHEIRTPMNAVLGFTELVLESNLNEEQRQYLDIVKGRSQDLLRIIDDILDLARIEADRMGLIDEPFRVRDAVSSAMASVRLRIEQKGLSTTSAIADDVPEELRGDSLRLRQVLLNLLSNAIKFTAQGAITVHVETVQLDSTTRCGLRFTVRDTGIGIPQTRQEAIFEPFVQADTSTIRNYGGTGLGLTICRRLVEKMGGEITVKSEPGQGSSFSFTAFFRRVVASKASPSHRRRHTTSMPLPSMRILIVEDDPTSRMLVSGMLRREGHAVEEACEGEAAVVAVRAKDFDAVLMDVQMPGMDGLTATRVIRDMAKEENAESRRRSQVPIIALTAHAMRGDSDRCLDAGMNRYLAKPVETDRLRACLREFSPSAEKEEHGQD
jgi:signal transduction histidine kinase/ActR/RegA family two-component response regulator